MISRKMKLFEHEKHAGKSLNFSLKQKIVQLFGMHIYQFKDPRDFMPEYNSVITCAWTQHSTTWLKFFFILNAPALKLLCPFFPHCIYIWYKHVFKLVHRNCKPKNICERIEKFPMLHKLPKIWLPNIRRLQ